MPPDRWTHASPYLFFEIRVLIYGTRAGAGRLPAKESPNARSKQHVAQIVVVKFDQVEGEQYRLLATLLAPQRMEVRCPVLAGNHGLAVDQERMRVDAKRGVNDGGEAVGPVMTVAGEAVDAPVIPAHHQPVAVMLDFVNPQLTGRRYGDLRRQARFDEARGTSQNHGR